MQTHDHVPFQAFTALPGAEGLTGATAGAGERGVCDESLPPAEWRQARAPLPAYASKPHQGYRLLPLRIPQ
jgi:hypothetical protein